MNAGSSLQGRPHCFSVLYCAEWADNEGINPHHLLLPHLPKFDVLPAYSILNSEGNNKYFDVTAISTQAQDVHIDRDGRIAVKDVSVKLIPYYAWNHRGAGKMDVWLARSLSGLED